MLLFTCEIKVGDDEEEDLTGFVTFLEFLFERKWIDYQQAEREWCMHAACIEATRTKFVKENGDRSSKKGDTLLITLSRYLTVPKYAGWLSALTKTVKKGDKNIPTMCVEVRSIFLSLFSECNFLGLNLWLRCTYARRLAVFWDFNGISRILICCFGYPYKRIPSQ